MESWTNGEAVNMPRDPSVAIPVARSGGALRMKAIVSRGPGFRRARPTIRR